VWQRRGTGLYWERYEREGYNPKLNRKVITTRRRIKVEQELPMGEEHGRFLQQLLRQTVSAGQGGGSRVHLLRTGEVQANLVRLNEIFHLPQLPDLIARKVARRGGRLLPPARA
jgi:hypothetical protein